jgi:hypothetical protein
MQSHNENENASWGSERTPLTNIETFSTPQQISVLASPSQDAREMSMALKPFSRTNRSTDKQMKEQSAWRTTTKQSDGRARGAKTTRSEVSTTVEKKKY